MNHKEHDLAMWRGRFSRRVFDPDRRSLAAARFGHLARSFYEQLSLRGSALNAVRGRYSFVEARPPLCGMNFSLICSLMETSYMKHIATPAVSLRKELRLGTATPAHCSGALSTTALLYRVLHLASVLSPRPASWLLRCAGYFEKELLEVSEPRLPTLQPASACIGMSSPRSRRLNCSRSPRVQCASTADI